MPAGFSGKTGTGTLFFSPVKDRPGSETTVPLSCSKNKFPQLLGSPTGCPPLAVFLNPPSSPQPNGWATKPPIHKWRIPPSKGNRVRSPRSTNQHQPLRHTPPAPLDSHIRNQGGGQACLPKTQTSALSQRYQPARKPHLYGSSPSLPPLGGSASLDLTHVVMDDTY